MEIVAARVFSFSILPVIIAAGHLGLDRSSRPRERRLEIFLLYLFGSASREAELADSLVTSSFRTRSRNPSAGRLVIPFSSRLALPTWQWASLASSPWAGAMASVRPPSSR
jgi:hypothetical protein